MIRRNQGGVERSAAELIARRVIGPLQAPSSLQAIIYIYIYIGPRVKKRSSTLHPA